MDSQKPILFLLSLLLFALVDVHGHISPIVVDEGLRDDDNVSSEIQTYIVHVRKPEDAEFLRDEDLEDWHRSFLPNSTLDSGEPRLVYSYREAMSGFAARLTREEVRAMDAMEGFLQAEPDGELQLQTTYTPGLLGLNPGSNIWVSTSQGAGIIIGVVDSGALPTHPSFKDDGMPPPPKKWRGRCEYKRPVCNKKIIGARAFKGKGRPSPTDKDDGHGTHVAGIAAGNFVSGAEVLGNAQGTAVGMAPKAHLAIYKVCHHKHCSSSDVLAGMEGAILDGVDVISISLYTASLELKSSKQAIASFAAMKKGILTCGCAGNEGPAPSVIGNEAPWILTVGAASTDRRIKVTVRLGNGMELDGETAYQPSTWNSSLLPIAYMGDYPGKGTYGYRNDSFNNIDVKGKIVLCDVGYNVTYLDKGEFVKRAGGAAMILLNGYWEGSTTIALAHALPAVHVGEDDAEKIYNYYDSVVNISTPMAAITFKGTTFGARPSPVVPSFSGRGPSLVNGGILKPDIIAPGVNILSAWPVQVGPNANNSSTSTFSFVSGTSMATPHVSGIVALIKKARPRWSPAAIKSAIMTTAYELDRLGNNIIDQFRNTNATRFAMGAGHVNPLEATNPGLVYDLRPSDYVRYLCGMGYKDSEVELFVQRPIQCSKIKNIIAEQLNYPSISVSLGSNSTKTIKRKVTNVGAPDCLYSVDVDAPDGVTVDVSPSKLQFNSTDQVLMFSVKFTTNAIHPNIGEVSDGQLSWSSRSNAVKSPIVVSFV